MRLLNITPRNFSVIDHVMRLWSPEPFTSFHIPTEGSQSSNEWQFPMVFRESCMEIEFSTNTVFRFLAPDCRYQFTFCTSIMCFCCSGEHNAQFFATIRPTCHKHTILHVVGLNRLPNLLDYVEGVPEGAELHVVVTPVEGPLFIVDDVSLQLRSYFS